MMLDDLLLKAYGGLWTVASPLLRRHKRLAQGFDERLVPPGWPGYPSLPAGGGTPPRVWIQAASGGEAWLVHSLLPAFFRALSSAGAPSGPGADPAEDAPSVSRHGVSSPAVLSPDAAFASEAGGPSSSGAASPGMGTALPQILCTTCTRQGLDVLGKLPPDYGVLTRFFPLDKPSIMVRALDAVAPQLIVLLETELWPGLLDTARRRGVPVLMLNGRMTEKSFKHYSFLSRFWSRAAPSAVLAVAPEDAKRFAALLHCPVSVMANIKFDRLAAAAASPPPPPVRADAGIPEDALLAVFASVREEEEDLLIPVIRAITELQVNGVPVVAAVAPRHMHRVRAWRDKLGKVDLPVVRRSEGTGCTGGSMPFPVYLWDSFGELQALYASADAAFVGGSLAPLGGQNFLEAPALGAPALVGPDTAHFRWVGDDVFNTGLVRRVRDGQELIAAMHGLLAGRLVSPLSSDAPPSAADLRRNAAAGVRERFLAWLFPKTGGSVPAARAMAEMLLTRSRTTL